MIFPHLSNSNLCFSLNTSLLPFLTATTAPGCNKSAYYPTILNSITAVSSPSFPSATFKSELSGLLIEVIVDDSTFAYKLYPC